MMRTKLHRYLAALLTVCMLLSMIPVFAFATEGDLDSYATTGENQTTNETEVTEPEATEAKATEPEATEAEVTEPETTEPEATETQTTEPETTEPEATEPEATEAEVDELSEDDLTVAAKDSDKDLLKAGPEYGPTGTTSEQPFASGTADSKYFRIPAMITLANGNLLAAADARYSTTMDGGGLDTIISISSDNGNTWNYSMPIFFPDSNLYGGTAATTVIDPAVVQGNDGTIYVIADVNPTGVTTYTNGGYQWPGVGTGYITVNGVERLALTSDYTKVTTAPSEDDAATYEYYVGDFAADGYAPVIARADGKETKFVVDECYNIYVRTKNADGTYTYAYPYQTQTNTDTEIQQNVFYKGSVLHVYNTGYLWLASSKDNGKTWSHTILNASIKRDTETALLVSPGRGTVLRDGTILIPFYQHDLTVASNYCEASSFIWSKDNGKTWHRTDDVPTTNKISSECEVVELADGTLRLFARNYLGAVAYVDAKWDAQKQNYVWQSALISTGVTCCSTCNVSAIMYSEKISGKDAILVAAPGNSSSRSLGRIFVFLVDADNSMKLANTFEVNDDNYAYSCLTELNDGTVGLLYEPNGGYITFEKFNIKNVADGCEVNGECTLTVPLYGTVTTTGSNKFEANLSDSDKKIVDIKTETTTLSGVLATVGSDTNLNDAYIELSDCLFTLGEENSGYYKVSNTTADGTTVYLSIASAGYPSSSSSRLIWFETWDGHDGEFQIYDSTAGRSLYFWRDGKNYFDRATWTDDYAEAYAFLLYRPAKENETSSTEIPGYVQIKSEDELKTGVQFVIVAKVGDSRYVVRPTTSTGVKLDHVAKLYGKGTVSTTVVNFTGLKEGKVSFTEKNSGTKYTVSVVAKNVVNLSVNKNGVYEMPVNENSEITMAPNNATATAEIVTTTKSASYTGGQGSIKGGSAQPLSDALFYFEYADDKDYSNGRYYTVYGYDPATGTKMYLSLHDSYYMCSSTSDLAWFQSDDAGIFGIYTANKGVWMYLNYYPGANYGFYPGTMGSSSTYPNYSKFVLYRPAAEGEASSTEIPGYVQITSHKEIENGGAYLIAMHYTANYNQDAWVALYPNSKATAYKQIMTIDATAQKVTANYSYKNYALKVSGVECGTTDMIVDDAIYRITVTPRVMDVDGVLGYYEDGKLQTSYTGVVDGYYVKNGIAKTDASGLVYSQGTWYYVKNGKVDTSYTGLVKQTSGKNTGKWYYVNKGVIDFTYTGLCENSKGTWYVKKGAVQHSASGLAYVDGTWYYVKKGAVQYKATGLVKQTSGKNTGKWYYVKNGVIDFTYTGLCENSKGTWYVKKGAVQHSFSGKCTLGGKTYTVQKGKIV